MYRKAFWVVLGVLLLLALTATVAWAAPASQEGEGDAVTMDPLWAALAPLLAISTAIERLMERYWERWEKKGIWPCTEGVSDPQDEKHREFKKAHGHWIGFGFGLIAVALTDARLFYLLNLDTLFSASPALFSLNIGGIFDNFTVGTLVDWLLTAFVIGWGGTELTHSILTGLVKSRKLWEETQEVKRGEKSFLDIKFVKDIIGPELDKMGVSMTSLRLAFEALDLDETISKMTTGEIEDFLTEQGDAGKALLDLLNGKVKPKGYDPIELGKVLDMIEPEMQKRFLGA